jgi:glycerate dehydrogenase
MKTGVMLINSSRGGLIDEQDLKDALDIGKVAMAAVDVVSIEPMIKSNPLMKAKNCIITPHIAWATKEARQRLLDTAVQNLKFYLSGKSRNVVC